MYIFHTCKIFFNSMEDQKCNKGKAMFHVFFFNKMLVRKKMKHYFSVLKFPFRELVQSSHLIVCIAEKLRTRWLRLTTWNDASKREKEQKRRRFLCCKNELQNKLVFAYAS